MYDISGTATFKGKPIPAGYLVFEPDSANGNSGPAGRCQITNGKYDTRSEDGRGIIGGPHLIKVMGLSSAIEAQNAKEGSFREVNLPIPLFPPYEFSKDLEKKDSQLDIDVPATKK